MYNKLAISLILIFMIINVTLIDYDPPHLSWSEGAFTDIGFYIHNARNKILFNEWSAGDWDNRVLFPVYNFIIYSFIFFTGISFKSINFCALTFFFINLILFFQFIKKSGISKKYTFLFSIIFLLFNFLYFVFARIPYSENFMIVFILATCLLILNFKNKRSYFLAGILTIAAIMTKTSAIFIIGIVTLFLIFQLKKKEITLKDFGILLSIFFFTIIFFTIIWYLSVKNLNLAILDYTLKNKTLPFKQNIKYLFDIFHNLHTSFYFRIPILSFFTICFFIHTFVTKKINEINNTDFIMMTWFILAFLQLQLSFYIPLRYLIVLIIPMVYFTIQFLNIDIIRIKLNLKFFLIKLFFIYIFSYNFFWVYNRSILNKHIFQNKLHYFAITISLIYFLVFILTRIKIKKIDFCFLFKYKIIIILIFFILFLIQFNMFSKKNFKRNIINISNDLKKTLPKNAVLSGWFAPELCINNNLKSIPSYTSNHNFFKKYNINYLVLQDKKKIYKNFNLQFIKKYYITQLKKNIYLYKLRR